MEVIGYVSTEVVSLLGLNILPGTPIYLGTSNISHMEKAHPSDYSKYGADISNILNDPDYVGINPTDNSIEYVKSYAINNEHVKVAVRVSINGRYFARSLYTLNSRRVQNFINKGTLKALTKSNE